MKPAPGIKIMLWGVKNVQKFTYCLCSSCRAQFLSDLLSVPRGTLVCIWEEFSRKGPPALPYPPSPQVCLLITSLLVDGISSNLTHIFCSPGKIF